MSEIDWSALDDQFEPAVVPDSIEPVVAWRSWDFDRLHQKLSSGYDGSLWEPGEPAEAICPHEPEYDWEIVPHGGWSLAQAQDYANDANDRAMTRMKMAALGRRPSHHSVAIVPYPTLTPAPGCGYQLTREAKHQAPGETCSCGFYAADERQGTMPGAVVGKVKLWGKVIPGQRGYRAQYAYPHELYAPEDIAPHLAQYGVSVIVAEVLHPLEEMAKERLRRTALIRKGIAIVVVIEFLWAIGTLLKVLGV